MFWRQYSSLFSEFNGSARLYEAPFWIKHSLGEVQEGLPPPLQQRGCLTSSKRDCLLSFFCKKKIAVFLWTRLFSCKTASASAVECLLSFFCKKKRLSSFFLLYKKRLPLSMNNIVFFYDCLRLCSRGCLTSTKRDCLLSFFCQKEIVFSLSFVLYKKRLPFFYEIYCFLLRLQYTV